MTASFASRCRQIARKSKEELYTEVLGSEELKSAFVAAVKEKKIAEFLKEQGCEATEAEVTEFLKAKQSAEGQILCNA